MNRDEIAEDPLTRTTASAAVADKLRTDIQLGNLQPGTRLRQANIAKKYAVSTTPVREAFQFLQAEGLIRIDPHQGAVVFEPTIEDMLDGFEIRIVLEQLAMSYAIRRITDEVFTELEELVSRMKGTQDPGKWRQLNKAFHSTISNCSGKPRLCSMLDKLTEATTGYSQVALLHAPRSWWGDVEHEELIQACRVRDIRKARAIVRKHLETTVSFMRDMLSGAKRP